MSYEPSKWGNQERAYRLCICSEDGKALIRCYFSEMVEAGIYPHALILFKKPFDIEVEKIESIVSKRGWKRVENGFIKDNVLSSFTGRKGYSSLRICDGRDLHNYYHVYDKNGEVILFPPKECVGIKSNKIETYPEDIEELNEILEENFPIPAKAEVINFETVKEVEDILYEIVLRTFNGIDKLIFEPDVLKLPSVKDLANIYGSPEEFEVQGKKFYRFELGENDFVLVEDRSGKGYLLPYTYTRILEVEKQARDVKRILENKLCIF